MIKVTLTLEQLENMLDDSYENGYEDGCRSDLPKQPRGLGIDLEELQRLYPSIEVIKS